MYFVGNVPVVLPVRDASGRSVGKKKIMPGEPMPEGEVESWAYPTIIAHLNLHLIEWRGEGYPPHESHKIREGKTCDVNKYRSVHRPAPEAKAVDSKPKRAPVVGPEHLPRHVDPREVAKENAPSVAETTHPKDGVGTPAPSKNSKRKKAAQQAKAG